MNRSAEVKFSKVIKEFDKSIPIVWGGAHPTLLPEMTLKDEMVDIIATGEGDISFPVLVSELKKMIRRFVKSFGVVFYDENKN